MTSPISTEIDANVSSTDGARRRVERDTPQGRRSRLPLARKVGYGAGQLVELVVSSTLNSFALFYATAVCGLPGALAGLALGAGLVVDAFMDPLIGSLSDGWRSKWGRRVPFMIVGIIPLLLAFNAIFALPASLSQEMVFVWLLTLSITLRVSLSAFGLPYQALGADLTEDYAERSSVAAWRWGIGICGTLAVIALGYGVFLRGPDGLSQRAAYLPFTLSLSLIIVVGAALALREGFAARRTTNEAAPRQAIHHRLFGEMGEMFQNPTFRTLFFSKLLLNIAQGIYLTLSLHMHVFFWRLSSEQIQAITLPGVLGLVLAAPIAGVLLTRAEKRTILVLGLVGMALFQAGPVVLRLLGQLPADGDTFVASLAVLTFWQAIMFGLSVIASIAIIPDAADEHEYRFGTRRQGLFAAGWAFATKAATGGGLLIAGMVLQVINFPGDVMASAAAASIVPASTVQLLALAGGPGAAALAICGIYFALFYRVDRKVHARIIADLADRRGA